jgi:hypothetical protein
VESPPYVSPGVINYFYSSHSTSTVENEKKLLPEDCSFAKKQEDWPNEGIAAALLSIKKNE